MPPRAKRRKSSAAAAALAESADSVTGETPTFPLFPKLPLEIQDRIWELALYIPTAETPTAHAFDLIVQKWELVDEVYDCPLLVDSAAQAHRDQAPERVFGPLFTSTNQAWRRVSLSCRRAFHALLRTQDLPPHTSWRDAVRIARPAPAPALAPASAAIEPIEDLCFLRFRADPGTLDAVVRYSSLPGFTCSALVPNVGMPLARGTERRHRQIKHVAFAYYPGFAANRTIRGGADTGFVGRGRRELQFRVQALAELCTDLKFVYLVVPGGDQVHPPRWNQKPRFQGLDIKFYEVRRVADDDLHAAMTDCRREIADVLRKLGVQVRFLTYRKHL